MKNYVIKSILIFTLIYAFVTAVILFMFTWYQNLYEKDYAYNLGNQQHEVYSELINQRYTNDFNYFKDIVDSYSLNDLNQNKDDLSLVPLNFIAFYELSTSGIIINNQTYSFKDQAFFNNTLNTPLSFYRLSDVLENYEDNTIYGIYSYNQTLGLFDSQLYIENLLPNYANNILFIKNNGYILNSLNSVSENLLADYIDTSTNPIFENIISKNESGSLWTGVDDVSTLLALSPINESSLYFLTVYEESDLTINLRNIKLYLLTSLLVMGVTFVAANLLTFYTSFARFTDIENARLKVYFNKRLIIKVGLKGKIIGFNRGFKKVILNYQRFKNLKDFESHQVENDMSLFDKIKRGFSFTVELDTLDGHAFVKFIPLKMGLTYVLVGDNLSKDDLLLKEYESLALINNITKIPNYNFFTQYMQELMVTSDFKDKRHAVVALNILDFRSINKLVGEKVANETLVQFVDILKNALKNNKYELFNTYVDNFIIVLHDVAIDDIEDIIEDLSTYLEATTNLAGTTLNLDIRAGIYELVNLQKEELNSELIFERAMVALKHANGLTTSKYSIYDVTLKEYISQRQRIEKSLIEAIENKEFEMYLQPQLNVLNNKIVSFEALIRWNNKKYNHISPQEFIRLAEENNLIIHIGKIVMEETARIAKMLEKYNITIAMNISPVQMIQKGFVSTFKEILETYNLRPHALAVEITETFMVNSMQLMNEKLKLLQNLGVDIHLDDFGMGYSSLLYLKDLPINIIKIDKTFVSQLTTDKYSKAIVNMIVSLSKNIGVDVIAEGVETEAQKTALQKAGVAIIQGWLIAKALPVDEAIEILEKYNLGTKK